MTDIISSPDFDENEEDMLIVEPYEERIPFAVKLNEQQDNPALRDLILQYKSMVAGNEIILGEARQRVACGELTLEEYHRYVVEVNTREDIGRVRAQLDEAFYQIYGL